MKPHRIFLTDKEVASVAEISQHTLSRIMGGFYRGKRHDKYSLRIDLRNAEPQLVGGYRRWNITKVASVLGVTVEELESRLS